MSPRRRQQASQLATALIEHSFDAIVLVDEAGAVLFANPATGRMLGRPIADVINTNLFQWIHEDDLVAFRTQFRRELKPGVPIKLLCRLRHSDGTWRDVETIGVNRLADPGVRGIILNFRDVTESKRADASRAALEDQLRQAQKMDAIGRLAGGVAHDFNNVLTAILGSAELLSAMIDPGDPRSAEAENIKRAAERGASLTRQLLAFSRPQRAAAETVDLVTIVSAMEPMLRRLVLDKISIRVTASRLPIFVRADESSLSQIVLNLVVNARDAMPNGGTAIVDMGIVELDDPIASRLGLPHGRYAGISVADTGHGIPPEVQEHLFEPFFTTKAPNQGTGLGLSIVYGIVKGLGGAIEVQSEVSRGTTFTIYLPTAADHTGD